MNKTAALVPLDTQRVWIEAQRLAHIAAARLSKPDPVRATVAVLMNGERCVAGGAADDIYEIGSVTKVFTTTLLALMIEEGAVHLEDSALTYLPDTQLDPHITVEHLATHTSGLPRVPKELMSPRDRSNPYAGFDDCAFADCIKKAQLRRAPGRRYSYSNFGTSVLGRLLAQRAGLTFETLLEERVCRPLGLRDTAIHLTEAQRPRLMPAHTADGLPGPHWDLASFAPAGALKSTAGDLLDYVAAQLDESHPMREAFRRARTAHYRRFCSSMGLGWFLTPTRGAMRVWHSGGTGGAASFLGFVPEHKLGVVVLVNRALSLSEVVIWNRIERAGHRILKRLVASVQSEQAMQAKQLNA
jgi:CubicO group peptidase (beta-lactamase class C family)